MVIGQCIICKGFHIKIGLATGAPLATWEIYKSLGKPSVTEGEV